MKTPPEYQRLIECKGISLRELGVDDVALKREDAISAIELLQTSAISILGGDVYNQSANRTELAYANWHCEPTTNESRAQFAERSCIESKQYIADYPVSDAVPLFGLVLDL
jgi:hypothetical protein